MRDLHTSPRNVWICVGNIHTSLGNVIIFECDCTESYQTTDHQSLLFSRVSTLIILCWKQHEWEMPCHLFHDSRSKSFKIVLWPQKICCGFWGRKARKVRSHLMYYWRWSLQNHICLPLYHNSNKVITAYQHDSYWLEGDFFFHPAT